jgi:hypothetical protein
MDDRGYVAQALFDRFTARLAAHPEDSGGYPAARARGGTALSSDADAMPRLSLASAGSSTCSSWRAGTAGWQCVLAWSDGLANSAS